MRRSAREAAKSLSLGTNSRMEEVGMGIANLEP